MKLTSLLPNIGAPISTVLINENEIDEASVGELLHAGVLLIKQAAQRISDPATYNEVPTFTTAGGADWNGLESVVISPDTAGERTHDAPTPPENYYDTLQALGLLFKQAERSTESALTHFTSFVEASMRSQSKYFGTPSGEKPFGDTKQYLRQTMQWSASKAGKYIDRASALTHTPGSDPELHASQPKFPSIAEAFVEGRIPGENVDRIIALDNDLTKYATEVGESRDFKDAVLVAFEPTLVEAGEAASPEELGKAKKHWMDRVAYEMNADGPSPSEALRKQPDNAIKTKDFPTGGGRIWMDATPAVYATFKNFGLHMLNFDGTPPDIPQDLADFLRDYKENDDNGGTAASDNHPGNFNEIPLPTDRDQVLGEDVGGRPYTDEELSSIEQLTAGQKLGAMLIGMFNTLLRMDPKDIGIKKSHGASAQLIIVQDIQTAHLTLGAPPMPSDAQRPPGPAGILAPVIKRPNPDTPEHPPDDVDFSGPVNPVAWTTFQSTAVNIGPMHPQDADILCCDSELVGQIWNGPDTVLNQKRTQRLFTTAQRRAILARDRGCQAPGCSVPAVYCDIHHIKDWLAGGLTSERNATTLCPSHHAAVHIGKWRIRRVEGLTYFQPAPWLDPYQPLLRNLYWNT